MMDTTTDTTPPHAARTALESLREEFAWCASGEIDESERAPTGRITLRLQLRGAPGDVVVSAMPHHADVTGPCGQSRGAVVLEALPLAVRGILRGDFISEPPDPADEHEMLSPYCETVETWYCPYCDDELVDEWVKKCPHCEKPFA